MDKKIKRVKKWDKVESVGTPETYYLNKEYSPKYWGRLQFVGRTWRFRYRLREAEEEQWFDTQCTSIASAKSKADNYIKSYLFFTGWCDVIENI